MSSKNTKKTFLSLKKDFFLFLTNERVASRHTLMSYTQDLEIWYVFIKKEMAKEPTPIHLQDIKLLRKFLSEELKRWKKVTVARRLSAIKSFLRFAYREKYIERNVAKLLSRPKLPETLPFVLSEEEAFTLVTQAPVGTLKQKRLRAVMELLYSSGIRVSELTGLTVEKIDFRAGMLIVKGKGQKERLVPMGKHCQNALREYIDSIPVAQRKKKDQPVFLNREGEVISVRTIQRDLQHYAMSILGERGRQVTPHTFRHSCATHLLSRGAGLREIQELLGHRSLVTTQKYTQIDREQLRKVYEKSHPRELES